LEISEGEAEGKGRSKKEEVRRAGWCNQDIGNSCGSRHG
jgi:hypothetical protein